MKFSIITLFPEMFEKVFGTSMLWKAQDRNLVQFEYINLRDFGLGPRHQVDDTPYGGGDGMLLRVEPIFAAVEFAKQSNPDAEVILMTPKGKQWEQADAKRYVESGKDYIIICPHYEGYDERILTLVDHQIKCIVTNFSDESAVYESFYDGLLEYPQYTKPAEFRGMKVPEILLSGNHGAIATWRAENAPTKPAED